MDEIKLRKLNQLALRHIEQLGTREDFRILLDIAAGQNEVNCLTLKQLVLSASIPESTLKRRLSRLVSQRLVLKRTTKNDHRVSCYSLPERTLKILRELARDIRAFDWECPGMNQK